MIRVRSIEQHITAAGGFSWLDRLVPLRELPAAILADSEFSVS